MREFPLEIREFAKTFSELQIMRQEADYALDAGAYTTSDVLRYIGSAERAIGQFEQVDVEARRGFAAHALFRRRQW